MPIYKNFKNIEQSRDYIRASARIVNPHNLVIKNKTFYIEVGNQNDYDLLKQGLVGMKNVKWIGIKKQGAGGTFKQVTDEN